MKIFKIKPDLERVVSSLGVYVYYVDAVDVCIDSISWPEVIVYRDTWFVAPRFFNNEHDYRLVDYVRYASAEGQTFIIFNA